MASIAAFDGQVGQCAYSAVESRCCWNEFACCERAIASCYSRYGAIAPGVFETPMMSEIPDEVAQALAAAVPFPSGRASQMSLLSWPSKLSLTQC